MHCEDFLVVFCFLLSVIERSKETQVLQHGVVGLLLLVWGEECVAKETLVLVLLVEQQCRLRGGRAACTEIKQTSREFDPTRGFPGEDINTPRQVFCVC